MGKITCAAVAAIGVMFAASSVSAEELWDPHLRAVDEGLAAGAALPAGVYGVLDSWYGDFDQFNNAGNKTGVKLDVAVEVPILLWQSPYKILGADYSAAIAQPFDYTNVKVPHDAALSDNGHWGTYNTLIIPAQLAWKLPNDFHVKAGLTVNVDDASSSPAHPPSGGGVGSGNGYWTLQPDFGVSWMHGGWDVSVNAHYDYNFKDSRTGYTSGQEIAVDYTVMKTIGKWNVGLGAYSENQISSDTGPGAAGCVGKGGCKASNYGVGPMVEYNLGGIIALAEYNAPISTKNDVGGSVYNIRLVKPF